MVADDAVIAVRLVEDLHLPIEVEPVSHFAQPQAPQSRDQGVPDEPMITLHNPLHAADQVDDPSFVQLGPQPAALAPGDDDLALEELLQRVAVVGESQRRRGRVRHEAVGVAVPAKVTVWPIRRNPQRIPASGQFADAARDARPSGEIDDPHAVAEVLGAAFLLHEEGGDVGTLRVPMVHVNRPVPRPDVYGVMMGQLWHRDVLGHRDANCVADPTISVVVAAIDRPLTRSGEQDRLAPIGMAAPPSAEDAELTVRTRLTAAGHQPMRVSELLNVELIAHERAP